MSIYDSLNKEQQEACFHTEGPVLILAGAGSGKTRVITHRIAYLIEKGVNPWNILAITFTNKAAGEMRERVDRLVGCGSESIWVSTFHSMCVRILRRYIDLIGYKTGFTIYDTDDQKTLMKQVMKHQNIDPKQLRERTVLSAVSGAKNQLETPMQYREKHTFTFQERQIADCYEEYQSELHKNNALDFDDLLMKTVELFTSHAEVLQNYQNRFQYIHVDEYQDTNRAQFELIRQLSAGSRNLCVVGDDDQSIYKFRGADIRNILDFETVFPDAFVVRLEHNYRSTQNILDAANAVIHNNVNRKEKSLWTSQGAGARVHFHQLRDAMEEAEFIADDIRDRMDGQGSLSYRDFAVLYRTNAQARVLEERFVMDSIPYNVVGGTNFYARKEIKDLLAYLKTVDNGADDIAVRRILNVPKRGIGAATQDKVAEFAAAHGISFFEALERAGQVPTLSRSTAAKIMPFTELIHSLRKFREEKEGSDAAVSELLKKVIADTGYVELLKESDEEDADDRIGNIDELVTKAVSYEQSAAEEPATLSGFLEEVALIADIDSVGEDDNRVLLMTLHSAKGLEFPFVYMAGMEEGIFPGEMTIHSENAEEMEEERRLCYVGITRAKSELTLTCAKSRMLRGELHFNAVSRFVYEIPQTLLDGKLKKRNAWADDDWDEDGADDGDPFEDNGFYGGSGHGRTFVTYGYAGRQAGGNERSSSYGARRRELGSGAGESHLAFSGGGQNGGLRLERFGAGEKFGTGNDGRQDDSCGVSAGSVAGTAPTGHTGGGRDSDRNSWNRQRPNGTGSIARSYADAYDTEERPRPAAYSADGRPKAVYRGTHTDDAHKPFIARTKSLAGLKKGSSFQMEKPSYEVGDRVRHVKFGEGVVEQIEETPRDYKVTVKFDTYGQKVMYAAFAKLEKVL